MSWLKRIEPVVLRQSSSIPYVILEDGVHLCFDNLYGPEADQTEHYISFSMNPNLLTRQSTNYWRFSQFPTILPFEHIEKLDNCIINGKLIRQASQKDRGRKNVSVTFASCLSEINDDSETGLEDFVGSMDDFDYNFILVGEELDTDVRLIQDFAELIYHENWLKTAVTIADRVCKSGPRRYCWTKNTPELSIACRGFTDLDDMEGIADALEKIGVPDFDCDFSGDL